HPIYLLRRKNGHIRCILQDRTGKSAGLAHEGAMIGEIAVALTGVGLLAGLLIGCIGVGGVILVPVLVYAFGIPIQTAIAAAMMGYILTGLIGTLVYARERSIRWDL